jgi:hypothetical protein
VEAWHFYTTTHRKTMSNKSPFEIRLEILKMTAELMQAEYAASVEFAQEMFDSVKDKTAITTAQLDKFVPKPFDSNDMVEKSKKFYEFVNAK